MVFKVSKKWWVVVILVLSLEVIVFVVIFGCVLENRLRIEKVFKIDLFSGVFIEGFFFLMFYILWLLCCFGNYCLMYLS